ncbi:MAG: sugar ABC transporter substrate-binding protein [Actinobacteria bacterium]|nr:sugar ABC transporter substrate-binding protein [Actinomycetota bacterium]
MFKRKRFYLIIFSSILVLLLVALSLAGCQTGTKAAVSGPEIKTTDITVGIIVEAMGNEWFQEMITAAKDEAAKQGVTLLIESSEWDPAKETQIFEDWISKGVDSIAVSMAQEAATRGNIWKATMAGIPVISNILEIRNAPMSTVIKFDNYGASYALGQYAGDYFNANMAGEKAKMAVLDLPIYQSTVDRANGFVEGFKTKVPDMEVVATQNAEGVMEKGMAMMETILQSNPDVNVVRGINDPSALGAASAVEAANSKAIVFGFDGANDAIAAVAKGGAFKGTVLVSAKEMGTLTVQALVKLVKGEDVTFWQYIGFELVTPENVAKFQK